MSHLIPRCSPLIPCRLLTKAACSTVRDLGEIHLWQSPHTSVEEHIIRQEKTDSFLARNLPPVKPSWQAWAVFIASGCVLAESPVSCSFPLLERTPELWDPAAREQRSQAGVRGVPREQGSWLLLFLNPRATSASVSAAVGEKCRFQALVE